MSSWATTPSVAHEDGIRAAYAAHGGELFRAARRLTHDQQHAEDLVQETFVHAWRAAHTFDESRSSMRTWLFSILRNLVIDHARAAAVRPRRATTTEQLRDGLDRTATSELDRMLTAWQVRDALNRVSEDHRRVLEEVHLRRRPLADVAAQLGIPVGTVKSRLYYALRAMRNALEESESNEWSRP
ncbi:MAG: sigma-70 family RNA polymerase sigma factor [Ilumatobacteraceae bacterium]